MTISDAPTVTPTAEDWGDDPCRYLERLHSIYGRSHGIVKIVLPIEARPTYKIWRDPEIKFKAKYQPLSMIDGLSRQEGIFALSHRIAMFNAGTPLPRGAPIINGMRVRLYQLKKALKTDSSIAADLISKIVPESANHSVHDLADKLLKFANEFLLIDSKYEIKEPKLAILCTVEAPEIGFVFWKAFKDDIVTEMIVRSTDKGKYVVEQVNYGSQSTVSKEELLFLKVRCHDYLFFSFF